MQISHEQKVRPARASEPAACVARRHICTRFSERRNPGEDLPHFAAQVLDRTFECMGLAGWLAGLLSFAAFSGPVHAQSIPVPPGQSVTVTWNPSTDPSVSGFRMYYGAASRSYTKMVETGMVASTTVTGLLAGTTYYFAVTAYSTLGQESVFSDEVSYVVPLTNNLPTLAFNSPNNGASYTAPAAVNFAASVTANGHTISKVQYYSGATLLGEAALSPYSFTWTNVSAGSYSLTSRAVYDAGSAVTSSPVNVTITNPAPIVALTSPLNGASYTAPAAVNLAASVTVNGHTITKVQFYNGATLLGEAASSPYSFTWTNVSAGSYSLTSRAVYDSSNSIVSAPASVTVTNFTAPVPVNPTITNPAPTVVLTSPLNGASYSTPAAITITAGVNASGLAISKVQFYSGATLLGEVKTTPYNFNWTNVSAGSYGLTARVIAGGVNPVDSSSVNVNVMGLPAPWQTRDLGSVSAVGNASLSNGFYTVKGAGNISGSVDNFRFVYQPLSGDGEIKVRLHSVGNTGTSGRVGVMIRESLTSGSKYAFMGVSPDGTFRWQYRSKTGGGISASSSTIGTPPNAWMRLVRAGNKLYGYRSTNGTNWTLVNSHDVTMASSIYIGLAVASGSSSLLNASTFGNVTLIPPNTEPTITLTSPANGASYAAPATINLAAGVAANGHTITAVQFFNGATLLGQATAAPYNFAWSNVSTGIKSLTARLVYDNGNTLSSSAASVTVTNLPPAPPPELEISLAPSVSGDVPGSVPAQMSVVLSATGQPGRQYNVLASPDFVTWTIIGNLTLDANGSGMFIDPAGNSRPACMYRLQGQ